MFEEFNWEKIAGGEDKEIKKTEFKKEKAEKGEESEEKKDLRNENDFFLNGEFQERNEGFFDLRTEYGVLRNIPKKFLPEKLKKLKNGKLSLYFDDNEKLREEIAKTVLNKLLNTDNNE